MEPILNISNSNFPKLVLNGNIEIVKYVDQESFKQLGKPKAKYSRISQFPNQLQKLKSDSLVHSLLL
ncbi:unnamed protein product [Paramecium primaurelia]|uniref:Uncharacterized protein n=1 Tax=Paramecium primaurelia TaxID=5886 RepID=A0A8S1M8V0_PARPR|nr:unnamed protein product [Paramecium primaurelia]